MPLLGDAVFTALTHLGVFEQNFNVHLMLLLDHVHDSKWGKLLREVLLLR